MVAFAQVRPGRKVKSRVEIFYEGTHVDSEGNKLTYTAQDIDDIAKNFSVLSDGERPILEPPIGIDHDTAQFIPDEYLSNTRLSQGEPVAVFAETVKIDGKPVRMLYADLAVTPEAKMLIDKGYLNGVSSEVINEDRLPEGAAKAGAKGKALRRIALLGYNLPALKRLKGLGKLPSEASLAPAAYAEHKPVNRIVRLLDSEKKPCGVAFFCDAHRSFQGDGPMPRQDLLAFLQSKGVDTSAITDAVPDALLEMMKKLIEENDALKSGGTGGGMSDGKDRLPKAVNLKYSDLEPDVLNTVNRLLAPALAKIETKLATDARNGAALTVKENKAKARSFCERMVKENRLPSRDLDCDKEGVPLPQTALGRLFRAVDSPAVHKFSDGGKTVERTELEIQMAEIEALPVRKFSERVPAQKAGAEGGGSKFDQIRQSAKDSRKASDSTKTIHQRLGMLPAAGLR